MTEETRWDPAMLRFTRAMDAAARHDPVPDPNHDLAGARARTEALNLPLAIGGPAMAESRDLVLPLEGGPRRCRLHRPVREPAPVLLYVHGGGWVWNSPDTHDRLLRAYAAAAGCAVLAPWYPLAPEAPFPQALEAVAAVARAVARGDLGPDLDGARLVLGGDSAGANLALAAALRLRDTDPGLRPRGLLLNYGVFDAATDTPSYGEFAEGYGLTAERMRLFWNWYAPAADRAGPLASPLRAALDGLPPVLLHAAALDVLRSENEAMAQRLRDAGVPVQWRLFPGVAHGFLRALGQVPAADESVAEAGAWLRARLA